jgi:hypothetical protein
MDTMQFQDAIRHFIDAIAKDDHQFAATLAFVEAWYKFTPTAFDNGDVHNSSLENQGSAKVLALATDLELNSTQVLCCFGEHYRDVLATPHAKNHFNLRRLQRDGFRDIRFDKFPLIRKKS